MQEDHRQELPELLHSDSQLKNKNLKGRLMINSQRGFAHIGLVIAAATVVAATGGVGYYVYNKNNSTKAHETNAIEIKDETAIAGTLANIKPVDEIQALAANDLGNATIVGIELEREDGKLVYKVKLSDGRMLLFDAVTGAAISSSENNKVENDEDIPAGFVAGISIEQARTIALNQHPGTIIKIELEMENGVGVYSVRFSDSAKVDVNANDGSVMKVEPGDEDKQGDSNSGSDSGSDDNSGSGSGH